MKAKYVLIFLMVVLFATTVGCSSAPPPEPTATPVPTVHPGKAIVSSNCKQCHDLGRVADYKGDHDGWALTVDRMILLGAKLTDEKRDLAIDYLASVYPKE